MLEVEIFFLEVNEQSFGGQLKFEEEKCPGKLLLLFVWKEGGKWESFVWELRIFFLNMALFCT